MNNTRIRRLATWHLSFGLLLAMAGMLLGIQMASSHNHSQHVTHAHMLLLGFVLSAIYGIVYRLWLEDSAPALALAQMVLHQAGTLVLVVGLYLLYGRMASEQVLGPLLGVASFGVLASVALVLLQLVLVSRRQPADVASVPAAARGRAA